MSSTITFRSGKPEDADACGAICYQAFTSFNQKHGFPPDFPNVEMAIGLMKMMLTHPGVFSVVAEQAGGRVVGSNFIWKDAIAGIGPITVDPTIQDKGLGREMMQRVIDHADQQRIPGVRLVQAAFNGRSLSLYTRLGFDAREPLACLQGKPIRQNIPGHTVRKATAADLDASCAVCTRVHGHERRGELKSAIEKGSALVVERGGEITGYATDVGFFGHTVAKENSDLISLIAGTEQISGPGLLLPMRNSEVFRWCLAKGLRVVQPMTLMSRGLYNEPAGAFVPSILF